MKTLSYVLSVTWNELRLIFKDRGNLAILFLLPILLSSVQGGANMMMVSEQGETSILLHVGLVNQDEGDFGREVVNAVMTIDELDIETYASVEEAEELVAKGESAAAIIFPANFSQNINDYVPTTVEVIVDPAQPESASIVTGIMNQVVDEVTIWGEVQYGIRSVFDASGLLGEVTPEQRRAIEAQNLGVIMTRLGEMRRDPVITVLSEDIEGQETESWLEEFLAFIFAGFTVMFIFFVVFMAAESVLKEREAGTLRRLVAAPIPRGAVIGGKLLAYMVLPCLQAVVLFGIANLFFDISLGHSPLALVVLTLLTAAVASSLGLLIATFAKTANQASNIGVAAGFILSIVGGVVPIGDRPFSRMGGFISILARVTPHAHALEGYLKVMSEDAGFMQILPEMGILLVFGVVFYAIATWRLRFD